MNDTSNTNNDNTYLIQNAGVEFAHFADQFRKQQRAPEPPPPHLRPVRVPVYDPVSRTMTFLQ